MPEEQQCTEERCVCGWGLLCDFSPESKLKAVFEDAGIEINVIQHKKKGQ